MSRLIAVAFITCTFIYTWFSYGAVRTMQADFGLSTTTVLKSGAFSLLSAVLVILVVALLVPRIRGLLSNQKVLAASIFVALLAAGLSEIWIASDEHIFIEDVKGHEGKTFSRPRTWPYKSTSLVHIAGKGIHATD